MNAIQRAGSLVLFVGVVIIVAALYVRYTGDAHYDAGYAAAVAAGQRERDRQAQTYRATEASLRADLAERDADAFKKEQDHAQALEAAKRRVRAGVDSLRCPASTVQPATPTSDRPAAGGPAVDEPGPAIVPETAADLLSIGADVAGLVRRYERVVERFEECRAVNAR